MPFTSQENCVSWLRMCKCCCDSLCTIQDTDEILPLTFTYLLSPLSNILQDNFRILFTGVIICDDEEIRHLSSDTPHDRSFL